MRITDDGSRLVWSASDLTRAAECEFAWARGIDARLGRVAAVVEPEDPLLARAARLGEHHESTTLAAYREHYGPNRVIEIPRVSSADEKALLDAVTRTTAILQDPGTSIVFQATFAHDDFVGFADFLLRESDGRWRVQDTKLARMPRASALIQLAAYVDQLHRIGVPCSEVAELILGDGTRSLHRTAEILPLFRLRRRRLRSLIADRNLAAGADAEPLAWADPRGALGVRACGRCATCELEVVRTRDLLLVARMRPTQRDKLRAAGVDTIDDLAVATTPPPGMGSDVFAGLRAQAQVQRESEQRLREAGDFRPGALAVPVVPAFQVHAPEALHGLPRPDPGDIFFDFEGDPLHQEQRGGADLWGLDYLFGWVDDAEQYTALWAHDLAEERGALERFLDYVHARRAAHPHLHIYHYAPYETSHLVSMAARHGVREDEVDRLLREGVFVDLYPIVLRAVRVGVRSLSLKKLEPLFMGAQLRTSQVQRGDDSISQYLTAVQLRNAGDDEQAQPLFDDLAEYNRDDCVSTRRLRNWLVRRAQEHGVFPALRAEPDGAEYAPSPVGVVLAAAAADELEPEAAQALRVAAAAVDYHAREAKAFWFSHYQRLREPLGMWDDTRQVVSLDPAASTLVREWGKTGRARALSREIFVRGDVAPGTSLSSGAQPFALYTVPAPFQARVPARAIFQPVPVSILDVRDEGFVVQERALDGQTWDAMPVALVPPAPPNSQSQQSAIDEWAQGVLRARPGFPLDPASDILLRRPPRIFPDRADRTPPWQAHPDDAVAAVTAGARALDRSYLAVQGPPGTGKTYTGARAIARLVRDHGWRIGVVAQSHAIVENLLGRIIDAGVPAAWVGKNPKDSETAHPFTTIPKVGMAAFLAQQQGHGVVVGGTAWDFTNPTRVARGELDLLVIDEAGQFSLASTIAVSVAAQRLLLLGDPQQLPEVSQGTHPEPVNTSALGWVMDGHQVIPDSHGIFLARSWRMHPAVAEPVSRLSYAGRLQSAPLAAERVIEGIECGVHPRPIVHRGNATESPEEAAEVVRIVEDLLGRTFRSTDAPARLLGEEDIIVVTPYNAQRECVRRALSAAGFIRVPVGTVDNFQGREAAVSITSLAASTGRDAPRGTEFLLLPNRLNVAVSRAQCVAYLVYSPGLLDDLPMTAEGVVRLSAFAELTGEVTTQTVP